MLEVNTLFSVADVIVRTLSHHPDARDDIIDFLMGFPTQDHLELHRVKTHDRIHFRLAGLEKMRDEEKESHYASQRGAMLDTHRGFWNLPLEVRALVMRQIWLPPAKSNSAEDVTQFKERNKEATEQLLERVLEGQMPEFKKSVGDFVRRYLHTVPEYQHAVILGGLLAANEPQLHGVVSPGRLLAQLGMALGPAENKCVQAIHSHPLTRSDIAQEIYQSKVRYDPPDRPELMKWIYDQGVLSEALLEQITRVGDLRGCGSFYVTVEIVLQDKSTQALQFLRPHARTRAESGLKWLRETALSLQEDGEDMTYLLSVFEDAEHSWQEEVDSEKSLEKPVPYTQLFRTSSSPEGATLEPSRLHLFTNSQMEASLQGMDTESFPFNLESL